MHYGFWYEDTKGLEQAILNTNTFVIDALAIGPKDVVLDAGCGVGGTSIHIAETTGARIEGITLSDVQLSIARTKSSRSPAACLLNFSKQDFSETNFKSETFSKVFGIESVCYSHRKSAFLEEAYRILKSGGKLAVVDTFLIKEELDEEEMRIYSKTIDGWVVPNLSQERGSGRPLSNVGLRT